MCPLSCPLGEPRSHSPAVGSYVKPSLNLKVLWHPPKIKAGDKSASHLLARTHGGEPRPELGRGGRTEECGEAPTGAQEPGAAHQDGGGSDGWGVLLLRLRRIWVASVSACPAVTPGLCLGFLLGPGLSCWSRGLWRTLGVENVSILSQLGLLRGFPRERGEGGVWPAWRGAQLGTGPTGSERGFKLPCRSESPGASGGERLGLEPDSPHRNLSDFACPRPGGPRCGMGTHAAQCCPDIGLTRPEAPLARPHDLGRLGGRTA